MGWFVAVLVGIAVISGIIIVAIIVWALLTNSPTTTANTSCSLQSDCASGYVCVPGPTTNICKAGLGTYCNNDSDCTPSLLCSTIPNSALKVCLNKSPPIPPPTVAPPAPTILPSSTYTAPTYTYADPNPITTWQPSYPDVDPVIDAYWQPEPLAEWLPPSIEPPAPSVLPEFRPSDANSLLPSWQPPPEPLPSAPHSTPHSPVHSVPQPASRPNIGRQDRPSRSVTPLSDERPFTPAQPLPTRRPTRPQPSAQPAVAPVVPRRSNRLPDGSNVTPFTRGAAGTAGSNRFEPASITRQVTPLTGEDQTASWCSTPCGEHDGAYYCRNEISNRYSSAVWDVCSYSDSTVYLLADGHIMCETDQRRRRITNNVKLQRIVSFKGYLYGLGETQTFYNLPNRYFASDAWQWEMVSWAPESIIHVSTTHDNQHLWLQTTHRGYLYDDTGHCHHEEAQLLGKRIYGRDTEHYLDLQPTSQTALLYPGAQVIHDIHDGALSYYDDVIVIAPADREMYRSIAIVNWKPYYIRA